MYNFLKKYRIALLFFGVGPALAGTTPSTPIFPNTQSLPPGTLINVGRIAVGPNAGQFTYMPLDINDIPEVDCVAGCGGTGPGGSSAAFTGGQSRVVLTTSMNVVLPAFSSTVLAYQLSGAATDTACFIYGPPNNPPVFIPTNTGADTDCGLAGSFALQGHYRYTGLPPVRGYVLYGQVVGTAPSDTFAFNAQW